MKKLFKAVGIAVGCLLLVSGAAILGSLWVYGPMGPIPGPELAGSVVEEPVADWTFVDAVKEIQIETRPEDPYSVTTWVTRVEDGIYVFCDDESPWFQYLTDDPRVRIRIEGRIYELSATRVADLERKRLFLTAMKSKYQHDFGFDPEFFQHAWDTGEVVLLRMEPR